MSSPPQPPGWWLATDGNWYPPPPPAPTLHGGPAVDPAGSGTGAEAPRSRASARVLRSLWVGVAVLLVAAVVVPFVPGSRASPANRARGPIIALHRVNAPAYRTACTTSRPVAGSVTSVPMAVVRSSALLFEFVPVCIDGRGPFPFVLDTGSTISIVSAGLASALRLPTTGASGAGGVDCPVRATTTPIHTWSLGTVPLAPQNTLRVDVPFFGARGPAGIIGSDVLRRFGSVRLDFEARQLLVVGGERPQASSVAFRDSPAPAGVTAELVGGDAHRTVPLREASAGVLLVTMAIGGAARPFVLDTGSGRSTVTFDSVREAGLHGTGQREVVPTLGCTVAAPLVESGAWAIGAIRLPPQRLLVVSLPLAAAGTLGSDVLSSFGWIVIDYDHGALLLGRRG